MKLQNKKIDISPIINFCLENRIRMKLIFDFPKYDIPELSCSKDAYRALMDFTNLEDESKGFKVLFTAKNKDSCACIFVTPMWEESPLATNVIYNGILVQKILDELAKIL